MCACVFAVAAVDTVDAVTAFTDIVTTGTTTTTATSSLANATASSSTGTAAAAGCLTAISVGVIPDIGSTQSSALGGSDVRPIFTTATTDAAAAAELPTVIPETLPTVVSADTSPVSLSVPPATVDKPILGVTELPVPTVSGMLYPPVASAGVTVSPHPSSSVTTSLVQMEMNLTGLSHLPTGVAGSVLGLTGSLDLLTEHPLPGVVGSPHLTETGVTGSSDPLTGVNGSPHFMSGVTRSPLQAVTGVTGSIQLASGVAGLLDQVTGATNSPVQAMAGATSLPVQTETAVTSSPVPAVTASTSSIASPSELSADADNEQIIEPSVTSIPLTRVGYSASLDPNLAQLTSHTLPTAVPPADKVPSAATDTLLRTADIVSEDSKLLAVLSTVDTVSENGADADRLAAGSLSDVKLPSSFAATETVTGAAIATSENATDTVSDEVCYA